MIPDWVNDIKKLKEEYENVYQKTFFGLYEDFIFIKLSKAKEALKLAKQEIINSGNWNARDYNWPKVVKKINDVLGES